MWLEDLLELGTWKSWGRGSLFPNMQMHVSEASPEEIEQKGLALSVLAL